MIVYFVEERVAPTDLMPGNPTRTALLEKWGLSRVFGDCKVVSCGAENGPGGKPGTTLYPYEGAELKPEQATRVRYLKDKQDWHKAASHWVGMERGAKVTPDMLRRDNAVDSIAIRLGDGNDWEVARALYGSGTTSLPRKLRIGADGKVEQGDVIAVYAELSVAAGAFFANWMKLNDEGANAVDISYENLATLAVLGLQANYRIGAVEALSVLDLFDEQNVYQAALATIGWQKILEMSKAADEALKKNNEANTPNG